MTNQRDLELQVQERNSSFAIALQPKRGEVVEVNGSIEGDLPYLVWVKPLDTNASPTQMFNPGTVQSLQSGMTVYYRQDPEAPAPWSLVRFDSATYSQDASAFLSLPGVNNPPHASEHIMTPGLVGPDPLNVYSHALVDFAVRPTTPATMRVRVFSGWYPGVTNYELFTGPTNTKDFTSDIPATSGKAKLVAICIDSVGVLTYVNGTDYTEGEPIPAASRPDVATNLLLITAVRLVNGMTQITNASFDQEMRPVFAPGGLARTIDAAKVTKLISPNGLINPVVSADDAGDVTIADGDLLFSTASIIGVTGALQINSSGGLVINEDGANVDTRFEGDNEENLLFLDGSTDRIGIYTNTPTATFNLDETYTDTGVHTAMVISQSWEPTTTSGSKFPTVMTLTPAYNTTHSPSGGFLTSFRLFAAIENSGVLSIRNIDLRSSNNGSGTVPRLTDIRARTAVNNGGGVVTDYYAYYIENQTVATNNFGIYQLGASVRNQFQGDVGIGLITAPLAQLHVDQPSTTGVQPVLYLDQADVSEEMIHFEGTIGTGNTIQAVGALVFTPTHYIKHTLTGGLVRYQEVGSIA